MQTYLASNIVLTPKIRLVASFMQFSRPFAKSKILLLGSPDLLLQGVVSLCVVMTMVTERVTFALCNPRAETDQIMPQVLNSAEVGAFLSGMLINAAPPDVAKKALHLFEPVRDTFGALFFSSIGYPAPNNRIRN